MASNIETIKRKLEHLEIVMNKDVNFPSECKDLYDSIKFVHQSLPMIDYDEIDLATTFLGYTLKAPLMITGMTGGHPESTTINRGLAKVAEKAGIAIGVGSQRAMIENPSQEIVYSYKVVREVAKNVPVIGNIGANTLREISLRKVIDIVDEIKADALAIHFNPAQELIQPEGNVKFTSDIIEKIRELLDIIHVPVIVKEVGNGLSYDVVKIMSNIGVKYFDVSGACGTNWVIVESYRLSDENKVELAKKLYTWGIPTPIAVIEARLANPSGFIIASGGVWSGLIAAINFALSADMVGFAQPILRCLLKNGVEGALKYIHEYVTELKSIMFLVGARKPIDLRKKPLYVFRDIREYLSSRGFDWSYFDKIRRMG